MTIPRRGLKKQKLNRTSVRCRCSSKCRPGDAGIVRKVLDNPAGDESLQEYIVEFGERVLDQYPVEGFRLRVHSDARVHCYLSIYLEDADEPSKD